MAAPTPVPAGFTPLGQITKQMVGKNINIIGVVTDILEPRPSKGEDWTMRIKLCDKTRTLERTSLKVQIFKKFEALPKNISKSPGDIMALYGVRVSEWHHEITVVTGLSTEWSVGTRWIHTSVPSVPRAARSTFTSPPNLRVTMPAAQFEPVIQYSNHLIRWWTNRGGMTAAYGMSPGSDVAVAVPFRRKFSQVREIEPRSFYDIAGYVVKTYNNHPDYSTIYITDYTKNKSLHNYECGRYRDDNWKGPWGQYTLQVTMWDATGSFAARNIHEGMYVLLNNVNGKSNQRTGDLEGAVRTDRKNPNRVFAEILDEDDPRVKEIKQRSKEYTRRFNSQSEEREESRAREEEKRKREEKKQIREEERQRREEERQRREEERQRREEEKRKRETQGNPYVECTRFSHPVTQLGDIIQQVKSSKEDFLNMNYRIFTRVVDFKPAKLEDFAKSPDPEYDSDEDSDDDVDSSQCSTNNNTIHHRNEDGSPIDGQTWKWRFSLLLEGKDGVRLRAVVEGEEADYLLGLEAVDLRKNPAILGQLREKLFQLWGNLEELKSRPLTERGPNTNAGGTRSAKKRTRPRGNGKGAAKKRKSGGSVVQYDDTGRRIAEGDEESAQEEDEVQTVFFNACLKGWGHELADNTVRQMWSLHGTRID